ncbi:MAG: protein-glutamate O-methyltransferase CheR [Firmicutes bacterium]|nr:protein-glutamate O-methyltransferase CheR [Bacillota bacterium]
MLNITKKEFAELSAFIKDNYGIFLKEEKKTMVLGRLQNLLLSKGFTNFTDYLHYLAHDKTGEAAAALIDRISTNHTFFMREADHFYYFRDHVLPYLEKNVRDKDLRVWCAACSTGEESYTLAILINEFFGNNRDGWDTTMLATDISRKVLEIAEKGVYSKEKIAPLPALWKTKYFKNIDGQNVEIIDEIKKKVIYRRFNLVQKHFPFKRKLHVIFCRNVMIYFDMFTKTELINKFYEHLEPGGYLFIGHSESINRETSKFKYVMPAVYRKLE